MKLKIKDLDYVKKLGQQSRTTSTHSPVLSKEPGTRPAEGCRQQREQAAVDTDVMEGEKIELDMSRQATAGAINQNTRFRRF